MNKLFISDKDFDREIPRSRAFGYKRIVIDEALQMAAPYKMETRGTDLAMVPADMVEGEPECYTILCKEFGMVGGSHGFASKVSVIFCDNGWMLVTLLHGGLVMQLDGQLLMPTVGDDVTAPKVVVDDILWVNADKLLAYSKYLDTAGYFMYDNEFLFELAGDNAKGMGNFRFRNFPEQTVDISLGYIAEWEQAQVKKQQAYETKKQMAAVAAAWRSSSEPMEFDEPDPDEMSQDEEDDDDSGVEW